MPADAGREHGYIRGVMPAPEDSIEIRRKRLLFRAWHRGTREADLILGSFAEKYLPEFDKACLENFAALLEVPDAELFDWISSRTAVPAEHDTEVTRLLLAFQYRPGTT